VKNRGRPRKTAPPGEEPKKRLVRCLGPGKEHTFNSPDPTRVRLCWRCKVLVREIGGRCVAIVGHGMSDRRRKGEKEAGS
jgi:hypothetical protein